jgi:hypothetical protein
MNTEAAQPGDVIEITWDMAEWYGKQFVVIKPLYDSQNGQTWIQRDDGYVTSFRPSSYKIVRRLSEDEDGQMHWDREFGLNGVER